MKIEQALQVALQHHQSARLAEAEKMYRHILVHKPEHADALHLLGVIAHQVGRHDAAVDLIRRATVISPGNPSYYSNLGEALRQLNRPDDAIAAYMQAIALNPDFAEAHNNLGSALMSQGRLGEAFAAYDRAIRINPSFAGAYNNLGAVLREQQKPDEAAAVFGRAIELNPALPEPHSNLGNVLADQGNLEQAVAAYARAVQLRPAYAEAYASLGTALRALGRLNEAVTAYQNAIRVRPNYPDAYSNLGNVLTEQGNLDESLTAHLKAIELKPDCAEAYLNLSQTLTHAGKLDQAVAACNEAIRLKPGYAAAYNNLGNALKDQGLLDDALAAFDRALALNPDDPVTQGNRARLLHFMPGSDSASIYNEQRRWDLRHAEPLKKLIQPHANVRDPDRRLKIGYVSPDFRDHPVGRFLLPLLQQHNHEQFEIFCYSDVRQTDALTDRMRSLADGWRSIVGVPDERLAQTVRDDGIDILVDLAMHTADNRLLVFARKPAPVQVTYLAYCSTTGLETLDYRLTDPYLDPPGMADACYSEESIRLPETYWCYEPDTSMPLASLQAPANGIVTFGCLNNFGKVSPPALAAWSQLLREVPRSRLLLHAKEGSHRQRVLDQFERDGLDPNRVTFAGFVSRQEYFQLCHEIDIGLDPFPCAGGATTCDMLWMGVPVVTLSGSTAVGRAGVSLLSNVGLPELVTHSPAQYVRCAAELAADLPRLEELRAGLRDRMLRSPLMDAPRFSRHIEAAYRQMWQRWTLGSRL